MTRSGSPSCGATTRASASKWGFDPLNPDMDEVLRRYGGTEVCWRYDEDRRRAGEGIAAAWRGA